MFCNGCKERIRRHLYDPLWLPNDILENRAHIRGPCWYVSSRGTMQSRDLPAHSNGHIPYEPRRSKCAHDLPRPARAGPLLALGLRAAFHVNGICWRGCSVFINTPLFDVDPSHLLRFAPSLFSLCGESSGSQGRAETYCRLWQGSHCCGVNTTRQVTSPIWCDLPVMITMRAMLGQVLASASRSTSRVSKRAFTSSFGVCPCDIKGVQPLREAEAVLGQTGFNMKYTTVCYSCCGTSLRFWKLSSCQTLQLP